MNYLTRMLENLEDIATNPNLNNGVWVSFWLFIKFSDDLLKNKELFKSSTDYRKHTDEEIIKELESIRVNFEKEFGFRLATNNGRNPKFESLKNGKQSHKFKAKLCKFIQSYRYHFLWTSNRCEVFLHTFFFFTWHLL